MKHPRSSDMRRQIAAVEAAGKHVQAVEYEWREQDGREVLVRKVRRRALGGLTVVK